MRIVVAIHDPPVWTVPPSEVERIARTLAGDDVVDVRDKPARLREFATADVLFATKLSADEYAIARRVRWIHSSAVGVGALMTPGLVASDVIVSNSRGIHSDAIAEHAIALLLALRRRIHTAVVRQVERAWAQVELSLPSLEPLAGARLLVVGLGTIGEKIARHAAGLGMRVTGVRKRPSLPVPFGVDRILGADQLSEGLREADAIILALPRTEETRALIGRRELEQMKPTALVVNIARGRLVDEEALAEALEAGRIAGAGLDAFHHEPLPPDHRFWRLPNLLITPHTAAFTGDYWTPVVDLFLENLARFRRGDPVLNLVDKSLGY
jgi:phosphoglycerate dehydrogenase-like enzyme